MLKCSNMVNSVHSHDLGTIGALETTFLENRFSILARMARVTRTHPLKDKYRVGLVIERSRYTSGMSEDQSYLK